MKKQGEEILESLKKTIEKITPNAKIILFGSHARGDAKPDSDWDILIIVDKETITPADFDKISFPIYDLGLEKNEYFSTKLYTKAEWQKRYFTPFYKNIEKEGIVL